MDSQTSHQFPSDGRRPFPKSSLQSLSDFSTPHEATTFRQIDVTEEYDNVGSKAPCGCVCLNFGIALYAPRSSLFCFLLVPIMEVRKSFTSPFRHLKEKKNSDREDHSDGQTKAEKGRQQGEERKQDSRLSASSIVMVVRL